MRHSSLHAALAALLVVLGATLMPVAATTPPPGGEPAADEAPAASPRIEGFRSADFGMDETAVRQAIFADFDRAGAAVRRWRNDLEQTTVLSVAVDDLVPDAGTAEISYVLGRGGTLIQVTILWGLGPAPAAAEDLEVTARLLIDFFHDQGFRSETGATPVVFVDGSNLLYYARDAAGAGLALSALPRADNGADAVRPPPVLRLAYAANLANPDVFRSPAIRP